MSNSSCGCGGNPQCVMMLNQSSILLPVYSIERPAKTTPYPIGIPVRATITLYPIGRPAKATNSYILSYRETC